MLHSCSNQSPEAALLCAALFKGICCVVANRLIGQQFSELWHYEDYYTRKENATVTKEKLVILDIRNLALNWVGYLASSFAHLLPDVSRTGLSSIPKCDWAVKNAKKY